MRWWRYNPEPVASVEGITRVLVGYWPVGQPQHAREERRRPDQFQANRRHHRKCAVRSATGTGSPRTRTRPRDPGSSVHGPSSPAPETIRVPSCRSLRALTLAAKSPSSRVAFQGSGPRKRRRRPTRKRRHPVAVGGEGWGGRGAHPGRGAGDDGDPALLVARGVWGCPVAGVLLSTGWPFRSGPVDATSRESASYQDRNRWRRDSWRG